MQVSKSSCIWLRLGKCMMQKRFEEVAKEEEDKKLQP
jgi:hypothetical protein